ncbi:MAG TPA: nucleotide exchange factor GrpE [Phycisphaerae bacterium]|nr:nucleotide exchange factor GrpE [Phycisphaerae bacterium]
MTSHDENALSDAVPRSDPPQEEPVLAAPEPTVPQAEAAPSDQWPDELSPLSDPPPGPAEGEAPQESSTRLQAELAAMRSAMEQCAKMSREAVETAARCQRDTAALQNRELQRHALHPAVRAAGAMAEELFRLAVLARSARAVVTGCPISDPMIEAALVAEQVAEDHLAGLEAERIMPEAGADLDPGRHKISGTQFTDNPAQHATVASIVSSGLTYRGEVLKRARVLVFQCRGAACSDANSNKETGHENA